MFILDSSTLYSVSQSYPLGSRKCAKLSKLRQRVCDSANRNLTGLEASMAAVIRSRFGYFGQKFLSSFITQNATRNLQIRPRILCVHTSSALNGESITGIIVYNHVKIPVVIKVVCYQGDSLTCGITISVN